MNRFIFAALLAAAPLLLCGRAAARDKEGTGILTNDRVIALIKNGTSESIILSLIEKFPDKLDSGPDALVRLRSAGASNAVLLAVRKSGLARQPAAPEAAAEEPAPAAEEEERQAEEPAGDGDTPGLVQKSSYGTRGPGLFEDGRLSVGLGYPFVAVKYDFSDYAGEVRFLTRRGVDVYSARGYWNFYVRSRWTAYTGLEAGYVRFGRSRYASSGKELAFFLGGAYALDKDFSVSADVAPTLIFWPGGGTHFDIGDLGWYVNIAVFFRLPKIEPRSPLDADASNTAAMEQKDDTELAAWRRSPTNKRSSYEDRLAAADKYVSQGDYPEAGEEYAKAMVSIPNDDYRRIFLYERRGWLALKEKDLEKARDFYLAAITAAKQLGIYDTNTVNAYCGLAYCFEKLENIPLAIKNYERAMDITASASVKREIEKTLRRLNAAAPQE